ncbi:sulfite exporter TauE/SafE family protein [Oceanimonas baumannii]|uniref:sulfite exporter TauE/SafE family protein n=1 Tax=Oceanimonas baumannii TaxID=129578 RepID=UPI001D18BE93|nr:sulfite exporter TauE/SafE family protein [Oceanimonas baumannii]MCC4263899.1 sulfite exporter TauE/SafE family protein [Oceanimonas baumannii]
MIDLTFAFYYVLLGVGVGFIAGLVGVGGGGLTVPAFTLLFTAQGLAGQEVVHMALGTSMAAMVFTTFSSMRAHYTQGHVNASLVTRMAAGAMVGTLIATTIAAAVNGVVLAVFFSLFMLYVAYKMFRSKSDKRNPKPHTAVTNISIGSLIGMVSALVSVSGAGMIVPYLMGQNLNVKQAVGTSAAIGFPLAVAGTLGYLVNGWQHTSLEQLTFGYIYLPAVALFSLASYFSAPLGVAYATRLPAVSLKKVLGVLSLLLSLKMLTHIVGEMGLV